MKREMRRLAAIVAADVVGYSRLMEQDESGTLARLKAHRAEWLEPALARNNGRLVKLTGDGALGEFGSAVDAIRCSIEFQQAVARANSSEAEDRRIVYRFGVHLGDIIVDDDDLYGDGVNVAARLESQAPPGGILVSRAVKEAVTGRVEARFQALGELNLKNISRPIRAFRVEWNAEDWPARTHQTVAIAAAGSVSAGSLALPDKPSIAVLPFQNLSGDPEQEYFADGMVEDILTGLSRSRSIFVIARNSSFAYKGKSPDIRDVGRELGVRYVLEGSVRKAGTRVRITGQLIDTTNGSHLWADRYDGALEDIFELQDQVTAKVIGAIVPKLDLAEMERAKRKSGNLQAYDYYLQGVAAWYRFTREDAERAMGLLRQAIALDPDFALAHAAISIWNASQRTFGWSTNRARNAAEAEQAARRALALDQNDARVLAYCGAAFVFAVDQVEEGLGYLDRAIDADPNFAMAWAWRGGAKNTLGRAEEAIQDLERALRLSPLDPLMFITQTQMAFANFLCGRYEEAATWAAASLSQRANHMTALRMSMAANAMAGKLALARQAWAAIKALNPAAPVADAFARLPSLSPAQRDAFAEAYRRASAPA